MHRTFERLRRPAVVFLHDLLIVTLAWFGAFWLRFNLESIPELFLNTALDWFPVVLVLQGGMFVYFGLYRGHWRFASVPDLVRILQAVVFGVLAAVAVIFMFTRLQAMPRSVFPLYAILLTLGLGGPRFIYRWIKDRRLYIGAGQRTLIVGAGRAGEMLVRDLRRDPEQALFPIGFVDDSRRKWGIDIHGISVLGPSDGIPEYVVKHDVELVIIAMPSADSGQIRKVVEYCEQAGVAFRMLPKMSDLVAGRISVEALREVSIEDLLGRDAILLDRDAIRSGLSGKHVLVSGGGGSIGSELCRQVAKLGPAHLIIFDVSEYNLYEIERELKETYPSIQIQPVLGNVTDEVSVEHLFQRYQPQIVLHAAAYKHVPLLEDQVREAVRNNVIGTRVMSLAASRHNSEIFVMVSTDKAVNPTNVMGASKRIAEIFCQNLSQRSNTRFITVRFGNVLGSAGSVVPLFKEQIQAGGPVTVTHPEITRYFMTIPEACQLILQSSVMGKGGEIYVLDMGQSVKILYLAEQMIRLSGYEPGQDIEIKFTGLRPGEKLYEELFHEQEALSSTQHEKILLANFRSWDWNRLEGLMDEIKRACESFDEAALRKLMLELVPEMQPFVVGEKDSNVVRLEQYKA